MKRLHLFTLKRKKKVENTDRPLKVFLTYMILDYT